jgi:hypothetical protein
MIAVLSVDGGRGIGEVGRREVVQRWGGEDWSVGRAKRDGRGTSFSGGRMLCRLARDSVIGEGQNW